MPIGLACYVGCKVDIYAPWWAAALEQLESKLKAARVWLVEMQSDDLFRCFALYSIMICKYKQFKFEYKLIFQQNWADLLLKTGFL
jgi:hypothetical protein